MPTRPNANGMEQSASVGPFKALNSWELKGNPENTQRECGRWKRFPLPALRQWGSVGVAQIAVGKERLRHWGSEVTRKQRQQQ